MSRNAMGYGKKAARKMDQRLMGAYRWDKIDPGLTYSKVPPGEPSDVASGTISRNCPARGRRVEEVFVESMISLSDRRDCWTKLRDACVAISRSHH